MTKKQTKYGWILVGISWGIVMFVILELLIPYAADETIVIDKLVFSIVIWLVMRLAFGYTLKLLNRGESNKPH